MPTRDGPATTRPRRSSPTSASVATARSIESTSAASARIRAWRSGRRRRSTAAELAQLRARLDWLDAAAPEGPWTRRALEAIRSHEGLRAADLCRQVGQERLPFKVNVRKLKALGLTESLEVGYRLSPRGHAVLAAWDAD